jgi:hypothetical protein
MTDNDNLPPVEVVLAAHMPLLRIERDSIAFAGGDLWRMPFETFDGLTAGAFSDHQAQYEAIAPVFYRLVVRPQLPNLVRIDPSQTKKAHLQMKLHRVRGPLLRLAGLEVLDRFHMTAVNPAWLALLLQAPQAVLPDPRCSIMFAVADEGYGFQAGESGARIGSAQGDADVEYAITPGFATTTLDDAAIAAASAWAERLGDEKTIDPALWPALEALGACSSPLLGAWERSALATVALEALLLPEIRSGMARTLARRTAALYGGSSRARREHESALREIYDTRSASLHGSALPSNGQRHIDAALGPRLLGHTIRVLDARAVSAGQAVAQQLEALDAAADDTGTAAAWPSGDAVATTPPLLRARLSMVAMVGTTLGSPDDNTWALWAPLAGLHVHQPMSLDDSGARLIMALSGAELLSLEERDIRRDFPAQASTIEEHIAALYLVAGSDQAVEPEQALALLQRERDLAVAALRMTGFHAFCDPALAGPVLMRGAVRFRRPSVLRQSVWQTLLPDDSAKALSSANTARLAKHHEGLSAYGRAGGHPDLERALSLYLRGFDRGFAGPRACAALHFALVECLLGRFRGADEGVPLENLVSRLVGVSTPAAIWFAAEGRSLRNRLAHSRAGDEPDDDTLDRLAVIGSTALEGAIDAWLASEDADARPGTLLAQRLTPQSAA